LVSDREPTAEDADRVLLFLHIPKTAGLSLAQPIYKNFMEIPRAGRDSVHWYRDEEGQGRKGFALEDAREPPSPAALRAFAHPSLRAVVGHFTFGIHRYIPRPSTYITVLREPVSRVVSRYAHQIIWRDDQFGVVSGNLNISGYVGRAADCDIDNGQVRRLCRADAPFGQCTPRMLARAKANLRRHFTLVGLTERFDETLLMLGTMFGWTRLIYQPAGVNIHRAKVVRPDERDREQIAELNRFDGELYEFAREAFEERLASMPDDFADRLEEMRAEQAAYMQENAWKLVDINSAPPERIARIRGIGPALADEIVRHRELVGGFEAVHELLEVPGLELNQYFRLVTLVTT
jgi:hypothetical protein